jgi:hypothetical protein
MTDNKVVCLSFIVWTRKSIVNCIVMNQELREVIVMISLSYYSKSSCFWKGNVVEYSTERGNQVAEINVRNSLVDNLLTYEDVSSCLVDHLAHSTFTLFTFWSRPLQIATTSVHCVHPVPFWLGLFH